MRPGAMVEMLVCMLGVNRPGADAESKLIGNDLCQNLDVCFVVDPDGHSETAPGPQ